MSAEPFPHHEIHRPLSPATVVGLRRRARAFAAACGSRLRLASARAGGDAGLALACALLDMIDDGSDPSGWPVGEAIVLLRGAADGDRQVARLLVNLEAVGSLIAMLSADPDDHGDERRFAN